MELKTQTYKMALTLAVQRKQTVYTKHILYVLLHNFRLFLVTTSSLFCANKTAFIRSPRESIYYFVMVKPQSHDYQNYCSKSRVILQFSFRCGFTMFKAYTRQRHMYMFIFTLRMYVYNQNII